MNTAAKSLVVTSAGAHPGNSANALRNPLHSSDAKLSFRLLRVGSSSALHAASMCAFRSAAGGISPASAGALNSAATSAKDLIAFTVRLPL
jgi:hypothetical protein